MEEIALHNTIGEQIQLLDKQATTSSNGRPLVNVQERIDPLTLADVIHTQEDVSRAEPTKKIIEGVIKSRSSIEETAVGTSSIFSRARPTPR